METLKYFEVKLVRSGAGRSTSHRRTLAGLGLTRVGKVVFLKDTPAVRGMLYKVGYLLALTPRTGESPLSNRARVRAQGVQHAVA